MNQYHWLLCSFAKVTSLLSTKEFKAGVVVYNKIAQTLAEFQILWHASWLKALEASIASLQSNLLVVHAETGNPSTKLSAAIRLTAKLLTICKHLHSTETKASHPLYSMM